MFFFLFAFAFFILSTEQVIARTDWWEEATCVVLWLLFFYCHECPGIEGKGKNCKADYCLENVGNYIFSHWIQQNYVHLLDVSHIPINNILSICFSPNREKPIVGCVDFPKGLRSPSYTQCWTATSIYKIAMIVLFTS